MVTVVSNMKYLYPLEQCINHCGRCFTLRCGDNNVILHEKLVLHDDGLYPALGSRLLSHRSKQIQRVLTFDPFCF
jgi:hypothetical protein